MRDAAATSLLTPLVSRDRARGLTKFSQIKLKSNLSDSRKRPWNLDGPIMPLKRAKMEAEPLEQTPSEEIVAGVEGLACHSQDGTESK